MALGPVLFRYRRCLAFAIAVRFVNCDFYFAFARDNTDTSLFRAVRAAAAAAGPAPAGAAPRPAAPAAPRARRPGRARARPAINSQLWWIASVMRRENGLNNVQVLQPNDGAILA